MEQIGPAAFGAMLRNRERVLDRFCKLSGVTVRDIGVDTPDIDESAMSVGPVPISTNAVDRVNDILSPKGCILTDYALNPVIYWEHGFSQEDGGSLPIASSEGPDRQLRIEISDDAVKAWSFFNGQTRLSTQVFSLVAKRAIRAASVRPAPKATRYVRDNDDEYFFMDEWSLEEWSWVGIPCNQEAVMKAVRDRRLDGEPLAAPLLKTFLPLLPAKPVMGIGMPAPKTTPSADPTKTFPTKPAGEKTKAAGDPPNPDEETPVASGEEPVNDDAAPEADQTAEETGDDMANAKYGAQVLAAVHAQIKDLTGALNAAMGPLENEEVKAACNELVAMLSDSLTTIEGLYSANYSDQPKLLEAAADAEQEPAPDEEAMKSFLASGRLQVARFKGHAGRLAPLATAKNLTPVQRKLIDAHVKAMNRMEDEAKSFQIGRAHV